MDTEVDNAVEVAGIQAVAVETSSHKMSIFSCPDCGSRDGEILSLMRFNGSALPVAETLIGCNHCKMTQGVITSAILGSVSGMKPATKLEKKEKEPHTIKRADSLRPFELAQVFGVVLCDMIRSKKGHLRNYASAGAGFPDSWRHDAGPAVGQMRGMEIMIPSIGTRAANGRMRPFDYIVEHAKSIGAGSLFAVHSLAWYSKNLAWLKLNIEATSRPYMQSFFEGEEASRVQYAILALDLPKTIEMALQTRTNPRIAGIFKGFVSPV